MSERTGTGPGERGVPERTPAKAATVRRRGRWGGHRAGDEDRLLLRLLTDPRGEKGDLSYDEARELRRRLEDEPGLASRFERLASPWRALAPPPDVPPPGFTDRVMARVAEDRRRVPSLLAAPVWARALATASLIAGLAAGPLLVARLSDNAPDLAPVEIAETLDADWLEAGPSLAESYLSILEVESGSAEPAESGDLGSRGDDSGELP